MSWVAGIAIMLAQYYLQPDMLLWHTFGYFHILAMLNGLCSLWFINCTAKGRVAKWLAKNVHKAIESDIDPATRLEEYRDLWVSSQIILCFLKTVNKALMVLMSKIICIKPFNTLS